MSEHRMIRTAIVLIPLVLALAACQPALGIAPTTEAATPTPEIFIARTQAVPGGTILLEGVELEILDAVLSGSFPAGCSGDVPACTRATNGYSILSVTFAPRNLPEGQFLAYKDLPEVEIVMEGGALASPTLVAYDPAGGNMTLGSEVPADARVFGLRWAALAEIPLEVTLQP
jgi:hypothetical protein